MRVTRGAATHSSRTPLAHGTARWSVQTSRLAPGRYRILVRAAASSGNAATAQHTVIVR